MNEIRMYPLTKQQSEFAAQNYTLVFSFLSDCKLDADEYHDAVIMHYLQAVQFYDEHPELQAKPFATVAKKFMWNGVLQHLNKQTRRKIAEIMYTIGLERPKQRKHLYLCQPTSARYLISKVQFSVGIA